MTLVCSLTLLLASVGCHEKAVGMTPDEQQAQAAADRIKELEAQLTKAQQDRAATEDQLVALRNELNKLKAQLAQRPEPQAQPAPGWESVPGGAMTSIEGTLLFDSGRAIIKPSGKQTLDQVAAVIGKKFPRYDIYVFGHTDSTPIQKSGWKDNYELSCQRALAVVRVLRSSGVDQKLAAAGWGDQLPVADNRAATARKANRRVEIFAMTPQEALTGSAGSPPAPRAP